MTKSKEGMKNESIEKIDELNKKAWQINRDEPEQAINISQDALDLSREVGYSLGEARANHNMGMCYGWLSKFDKALELTEASLKKFIELKEDNDCGRNHYSIATIYYYKGEFKKAKSHYHHSLNLYQKSENNVGVTNAYNGLGSVYTEIGDLDSAEEFLTKGLKLSINIDESKIRPKIYDGLATIYIRQNDYTQAKAYYDKALKMAIDTNQVNYKTFYLEGLGNCELQLENYNGALKYFNECLELRKSIGLKFGEATALKNIGAVYIRLKDLKKAESFLQDALELANDVDGKGIAMDINKSLAELYEVKNDAVKVSEYLKEHFRLKEELLSEEHFKVQNNKIEQAYLNTKVLSEIGQEIIASLELEKVLFTIYEKVNKLMDASVFGIGLYHDKEKHIEYKLAIDSGKRYAPYTRDARDKTQLAVWCIDNMAPVFINNFEKEYKQYLPEFNFAKEMEITVDVNAETSADFEQSILYVPILSADSVLGVISVQSREKNVYSKHHLDILNNIAVYAAIAIINAEIYENLEVEIGNRTKEVTLQRDQLQRTFNDTKVLNEIGQDISSSLSIKEVIQKVYKNINSLMDAAVFVIGLYQVDKKSLLFEGGMEKGEELPSFEWDLKDENRLAVICFNDRKEIIMHELEDEKKYVKKYLPPSAGENTESVLYLPLVTKDKTMGVISVQSFKKHAYSEYHINLLRNLANYASVALENALMYGKMEREVENRTEEIQKSYQNTKLLGEIGTDIISVLNINEISDRVYSKVNELMDANAFAVGIFNEEENSIDFYSVEKGQKLPISSSTLSKEALHAWCFKNQKEVIINDFDKEYKKYIKNYSGPISGEHTVSIIYLPLTLKDKKLGLLTVQSFEKNAYTDYHIDILRNLAVTVSTAVDNALVYESLEEKVTERTNELVKEKEKAEFEREEARYQRKRAEQSERFKQQFLANMSHEIRTPMNAIMGMTNLLLEKYPMKEAVPYLDSIKKSSESLLVIINDILDLSKIEAGKMELEQADFSLKELIRLVEQTISYRAEEKGLIISVSYDEDIPPVLIGDPVRLQQVLLNITGNAAKFTEKGGVTISVNLEGGAIMGDQCKLRFEVRDTGIGMTQEQQSKVFESFSQAAADTTRKYGGTGLGLSISSKLIELFGSTIHVESKQGEGSTFSFIITFQVSKNTHAVNVDSEIPQDFIEKLEGLKILLAEDNEYNQIVAIETLELKIPGVQITKAYNGQEACDIMTDRKGDFDVVLMDVQMPVMDGFDATRTIKKMDDKKASSVPIIALTASVVKKDVQMCFDAGMQQVVPKPFKTSELIEAIYKACYLKTNGKEIYEEPNTNNMDAENRITSLSFLEDFTEGDSERIKRYVGMYLDSARKNSPEINKLMQEEKWDELKVLVHSMKPHFDFMGMKGTRALAESIEEILVKKEDLSNVPTKIGELQSAIDQSIEELQD